MTDADDFQRLREQAWNERVRSWPATQSREMAERRNAIDVAQREQDARERRQAWMWFKFSLVGQTVGLIGGIWAGTRGHATGLQLFIGIDCGLIGGASLIGLIATSIALIVTSE